MSAVSWAAQALSPPTRLRHQQFAESIRIGLYRIGPIKPFDRQAGGRGRCDNGARQPRRSGEPGLYHSGWQAIQPALTVTTAADALRCNCSVCFHKHDVRWKFGIQAADEPGESDLVGIAPSCRDANRPDFLQKASSSSIHPDVIASSASWHQPDQSHQALRTCQSSAATQASGATDALDVDKRSSRRRSSSGAKDGSRPQSIPARKLASILDPGGGQRGLADPATPNISMSSAHTAPDVVSSALKRSPRRSLPGTFTRSSRLPDAASSSLLVQVTAAPVGNCEAHRARPWNRTFGGGADHDRRRLSAPTETMFTKKSEAPRHSLTWESLLFICREKNQGTIETSTTSGVHDGLRQAVLRRSRIA